MKRTDLVDPFAISAKNPEKNESRPVGIEMEEEKMKRILACLLCALLLLPLFAHAEEPETEKFTSGEYEYSLLEDGTAEIVKYRGGEERLAVPAELDGHSVTSIGNNAFQECSGLENVTIPDGVTGIGDYAFYSCFGLTEVTIPDSVTKIGSNPFAQCEQLSDIKVSPDHPVLAVMDGVLFEKTEKRLVCYPMKKDGKAYEIPRDTEIIGDWAFGGCSGLQSITIPDGVTGIGYAALGNCSGLENITIPDSVTDIGDWAFYGCSGLQSITIPDGVTDIGEHAFSCCSGLQSITIPDGVTGIGYAALEHCSSLESITIPGSVTDIGNYSFFECSNLGTVTLEDGVAGIGDYAFSNCTSLKEITIPDSVTKIGANPFSVCEQLSQIKVSPDQPVLAVMDGVLFEKTEKRLVCYPMMKTEEAYEIPRGIKIIGEYAFCVCSDLQSITIPSSVKDIGHHAFSGCSNLGSVTLEDGVASIGNLAFLNCFSLEEITIPDSVTRIGENPFSMCKQLSAINVSPDHPTLEVIDGALFEKTTSFKETAEHLICYPIGKAGKTYVIPQGTRIIGVWAFYGCTSLEKIEMPSSMISIMNAAFYGCTSLEKIEIPSGVAVIGNAAFAECPNLTITVTRDSFAANYCKENSLKYTYTDSLDWLSSPD